MSDEPNSGQPAAQQSTAANPADAGKAQAAPAGAGAADKAAPGSSPGADAAQPALAIPENFAYAKDGKLDFDAWSKDAQELSELRAKAAERAKAIPESPDKYALTVSEDLKLSNGQKIEIDAEDPLWGEFRGVAKELGWTQAEVDKVVSLYAKRELARESGLAEAIKAAQEKAEADAAREMAQLADPKESDLEKAANAGLALWKGVETELQSTFGDDGKAVASQLKTAAAVRIFRQLLDAADLPSIGKSDPNRKAPAQSMAERWYPSSGAKQ